MSTTWGNVLARVRRFLTDSDSSNYRWTEDELADAWIDAQLDLVGYVSKRSTFTVAEGAQTYTLPADFYRVMFVKNANGYTMRSVDPFDYMDEDVWEGLYWYTTDTTIEFTDELDAQATVYYQAYYPEPTSGTPASPITIPGWAIQACTYYVAAQAIERQVAKDPQLRQWARRTDAGNPTDNPFTDVADYFLKRYREVIYSHVSGDNKERSSWRSS
jgi:hypothetical protein